MDAPALRFLTDANVQRSVAVWLRARGHEVFESRAVVGADAADSIINWIASDEGLIIVTYDRDFRTAARRAAPAGAIRQVQHRASVLWLHIPEPQANQRLKECFALIEQQFHQVHMAGFRVELCEIQADRVVLRIAVPRTSGP